MQSIDGVVAMSGVDSSGPVLSGRSAADRFVMGLLRAAASAVMIGAGTLRDTPKHHWTAEHIYPELASDLTRLRGALGLPERPRLVVITGSGAVDVGHPAIREGATFLTTDAGAERLKDIIPASCDLRSWPADRVPLPEGVAWLQQQGHRRILSEAGPTVMGQLLQADLLDELFVTLSPVLAGRDGGGRPGLIEGITFLPGRRIQASIRSMRRSGDYILLRYSLAEPS